MALTKPHTVDAIAGGSKTVAPPPSAHQSGGGNGQRLPPPPPPPLPQSTSSDTDPQARLLAAISGQNGVHGCERELASIIDDILFYRKSDLTAEEDRGANAAEHQDRRYAASILAPVCTCL